jgi:hypothetical protein
MEIFPLFSILLVLLTFFNPHAFQSSRVIFCSILRTISHYFQLNSAQSDIISPIHKRAEGRAPVWGSKFTTKVAHYRGDSSEAAAGLKQKFCDLRACEPPL